MNDIVWKRIKELKESDIIEKFEKDNFIILPKELKLLVKECNGGRPSLKTIKTEDAREVEIKSLLSFNKEDIENIHKVIKYFKENYNNKIIPFATEPSGDYFCINLENNNILYWNQETNIFSYVSKDIQTLLESLY